MRKKIHALVVLSFFAVAISACKDDNKEPKKEPVDIIFNSENSVYSIEVGAQDTIKAKIVSKDKITGYEWEESGKLLGTDSVLVFSPKEEKEYQITLKVKTEKSFAEKSCKVIGLNANRNAMFLINLGRFEFERNKIISFRFDLISPSGKYIKDPLKKANPGFDYDNFQRILPIMIYKDKFYMVSTDKQTISVFNRSTFKQEGKSFLIPVANQKKWVSATVLNEDKIYLFSRDGRIVSVNLKTSAFTEITDLGVNEFNPGTVQPVYKGKLYAMGTLNYSDTKMIEINTETDKVESSKLFKKCYAQVSVIAKGSDVCILSGDPFSTPDYLFVLSLEKKEMKVNGVELEKRYHNGLCSVAGEPAFTFVTKQKVEVCKYNYETAATTVIEDNVAVPEDTNKTVKSGLRKNQLFVSYENPNDMTNDEISVYDMTKPLAKPIAKYISFEIDQYLFNKF